MPIRLTQEDTMSGVRRQGYTTTRRGCLSQPDRQVDGISGSPSAVLYFSMLKLSTARRMRKCRFAVANRGLDSVPPSTGVLSFPVRGDRGALRAVNRRSIIVRLMAETGVLPQSANASFMVSW